MSRSAKNGGVDDIDNIVLSSQYNNAAHGITGLLLFDGYRFMQAIEGPTKALLECYARIEADSRHFDLVKIDDSAIDSPEFGSWTMRYRSSDTTKHGEEFAKSVISALGGVNSRLLAHFVGFAALARP